MKINTKKSSKNILLISGSIAAVILIAGVLAYPLYKDSVASLFSGNADTSETADQTEVSDTPDIETPASDEQIQDGQDIKKQTIDNDQNQTSGTDDVTMVISRATQVEQTVQIRTLIEAVTSGTCEISIVSGSNRYTDTANTQALASSTTCKGFDIPISELDTGTWDISVTFSNSNQSGAVSASITVE